MATGAQSLSALSPFDSVRELGDERSLAAFARSVRAEWWHRIGYAHDRAENSTAWDTTYRETS